MSNVKKQKLKMRNTGSFFNLLMGNNQSVPVVGKGATIMHWTDRSVAEVISVSEDGMRVVIESLNAEYDGEKGTAQMGHQDWKFSPTGIFKTIVWFRGAWRYENFEVVFTKEFKEEANKNGADDFFGIYLSKTYPEMAKEIYADECYPQKVVAGITRLKKRYDKVNILFGQKNYHYDWSF